MKSDTLVTWLAFLGLSAAAVLAIGYLDAPVKPVPAPVKPAPAPTPTPAPPKKACKPGCGCKTTGHCCCGGSCSAHCSCGPDCTCGHKENADAPAVGAGPTQEGGKTSPDGTYEVVCDLPQSEKKHNVGGRDGAGLCVFTSIEYAGRWQNERRLYDLQQKMRSEPGGGYPEKVAAMLARYAPGVNYLQDTTGNEALLKAALAAGRMPGVTYDGHDCHYPGTIGHMVDLVGMNEKWAVISDNNFPADNTHTWMSPADFLQRWKGNSGGWCFVLLNPTPPPPPHAAARK